MKTIRLNVDGMININPTVVCIELSDLEFHNADYCINLTNEEYQIYLNKLNTLNCSEIKVDSNTSLIIDNDDGFTFAEIFISQSDILDI